MQDDGPHTAADTSQLLAEPRTIAHLINDHYKKIIIFIWQIFLYHFLPLLFNNFIFLLQAAASDSFLMDICTWPILVILLRICSSGQEDYPYQAKG